MAGLLKSLWFSLGFSGPVREQCGPLMVFAIPLKPKAASRNWGEVQENLRRTLRSILASGNGDYRAVVVCHDEPDLSGLPMDRIDVVRFWRRVKTKDPRDRHRDKTRKRRQAAAWVRRRYRAERYYIMFLDADDLVDRDLVAHVIADDNRQGYVIDKGYNYDCFTGRMVMESDFYRRCGSCFIGCFTREDLPRWWWDKEAYFSRFKNHREFLETAGQSGKMPVPVPFPAVVYMGNHPESLMVYRRQGKARKMMGKAKKPGEVEDVEGILRGRFAFSGTLPRQVG